MGLITGRKKIIETIEKRPEGIKKLYVLRKAKRNFVDILGKAREKGISIRFIEERERERRLKDKNISIYLMAHDFSYIEGDKFLMMIKEIQNPAVALFDGIYDPQNFGSILRSASALGIDGIVIPKDRSCGITETVKRISKGGIEFVKIVRIVNVSRYLEAMKEAGLFVIGLDERGKYSLFDIDLTRSICLVFGREEGMRKLTQKSCDLIAKIPTSKIFPSLNLATSFAITLYELKRQRLKK